MEEDCVGSQGSKRTVVLAEDEEEEEKKKRWRENVWAKGRCNSNILHVVTTQNTLSSLLNAVLTQNPTTSYSSEPHIQCAVHNLFQ
jgi:hypothetical protein